MRTTILSLILLTVAACMRAEVQLQNSEVNSQWRTKTISVKNGGQSPDVIKLLRAFNEALPTWVVGEVLKQADHPAKGTRQSGTASIYEDEYDFRILIDRKNGYADLTSETDINQMSACIWRKDNGHRIFAVSLYEQHDMPQNLLCWYDYDPQTQTMKPEKSPLDDFQPDVKGTPISWDLPMKGTDFTITEYFIGITNITHVYKWDKKQFHLDHSELNDFEYKLAADSEAKERISKGRGWSHYSLINLTDNGYPAMAFCNFYEGEIGDVMLTPSPTAGRVTSAWPSSIATWQAASSITSCWATSYSSWCATCPTSQAEVRTRWRSPLASADLTRPPTSSTSWATGSTSPNYTAGAPSPSARAKNDLTMMCLRL